MTSASNERKAAIPSKQKIEQVSRDALDHAVANMPDKTLMELAQIRHIALRTARSSDIQTTFINRMSSYLYSPLSGVMITAVVLISVSVNYHNSESIPVIPVAMLNIEVPNEDFALLEDLEFVTWLAENETSIDEMGTHEESAVL
jgi:hypothetical protein